MNRNLAFDLLRALAVLMVLGRHFAPRVPWDMAPILRGPLKLWMTGGWMGVDLFFVLSGYLVSGLLFREFQSDGRLRVGRFLIRRGFKIYPSFYLLFLVSIVVGLTDPRYPLSASAVVAEATFTQNYFVGLNGHTWSLAVEEHFYLSLPVLLWYLARRGGRDPFRSLPWIFCGLALFCLGARMLHPEYRHTHGRMDSLFFGVVLSYGRHFHWQSLLAWIIPRRVFLAGFGVTLLAPFFVIEFRRYEVQTAGMTVVYLGAGCLLLSTLGIEFRRTWWTAALAKVGVHSYSIYLWHLVVHTHLVPQMWIAFDLPMAFSPGWYLANTLVYLTVAIGVGILAGELVEQPLLNLRDRLVPSTRAGQTRPVADGVAGIQCLRDNTL